MAAVREKIEGSVTLASPLLCRTVDNVDTDTPRLLMRSISTLSDRRGVWAFVVGVIAVTGGVLLHAPMLWMGRHNHFVLNGMPIGRDMILGMVAIVGGL